MGANASTDRGEQKAYEIIKKVPVVGTVYSGVSSIAHAGRGNGSEAERRGHDAVNGLDPSSLGGVLLGSVSKKKKENTQKKKHK